MSMTNVSNALKNGFRKVTVTKNTASMTMDQTWLPESPTAQKPLTVNMTTVYSASIYPWKSVMTNGTLNTTLCAVCAEAPVSNPLEENVSLILWPMLGTVVTLLKNTSMVVLCAETKWPGTKTGPTVSLAKKASFSMKMETVVKKWTSLLVVTWQCPGELTWLWVKNVLLRVLWTCTNYLGKWGVNGTTTAMSNSTNSQEYTNVLVMKEWWTPILVNVNIPVKTPLYNGSLRNVTAKLAFNQCVQKTIIVKIIFVYTFTIPLHLTTNAWMAVNGVHKLL